MHEQVKTNFILSLEQKLKFKLLSFTIPPPVQNILLRSQSFSSAKQPLNMVTSHGVRRHHISIKPERVRHLSLALVQKGEKLC